MTIADGISGELIAARRERDELAAAIRQTLDENGHLADGDVCTLKVLKDALEKAGAGDRVMTVRHIVLNFLQGNGYDGLYSDDCGCQSDDLFPCDEPAKDCKAGYRRTCKACPAETKEICEIEFADANGFCIGEERL